MFEQEVVDRTIAVAQKYQIDPAALLAVVEVESAGKSLEVDGKTPQFLFERHIFYRQLKAIAPTKLQAAVDQGLAIPAWNRATQYKDEGTSVKRLALLERAKAIDVECAYRSCSWGVGQTMGFLFVELGFASATTMVKKMIEGGIPAQVECMVREIQNKKLIPVMNRHDWPSFARVYNGAGYKANQYDTKMALAYSRWHLKLTPTALADLPPEEAPDPEEGADLPTLRMGPEPMSKSTIGNGAAATGGLGAAGLGTWLWDKVTELPDSALQALVRVAQKPTFWFFLAIMAGAGYIWWRRYRMKEDGV